MKHSTLWIVLFLSVGLAIQSCGNGGDDDGNDGGGGGSDGPGITVNPNPHMAGSAPSGGRVFRFETFGNEGFWTDAVRLQQGIVAANVTPLDALALGVMIDGEAIPASLSAALVAELQTDLSPANAPLLHNSATTVALVNANAVIGIVPKDSNGDGILDVLVGDKTGATCALCHTITDGSIFNMPNGGSIGKRVDGRANHNLNFGSLVALGQNSRALYPLLQLSLTANGGATLGRAPTGLTESSTEGDVDAYLTNADYYPVGMFDDTFDGNGDPMHNTPLFETNLAAPWGSEGALSRLDNFSNLVYTALLDPTTLTTPGGRAFVVKLGGAAAGNEIVDDYIAVLAATNVTGYPYVRANGDPNPGSEDAFLGIRVSSQKLLDLNAYLNNLRAPPGVHVDPAGALRGRDVFKQTCTTCHNSNQSIFVPPFIVDMNVIWPGDDPVVLLAERDPPLNPILNSLGFFDDKMAVVNASIRGLNRGIALPVLLDLARKPVFLHDNSVSSLDELLDPVRGPRSPHPFYVSNPDQRADVITFLRSLDTEN